MELKKVKNMPLEELLYFGSNEFNFDTEIPQGFAVTKLRYDGTDVHGNLSDVVTSKVIPDTIRVSFTGRLALAYKNYDIGQGNFSVTNNLDGYTVNKIQHSLGFLSGNELQKISDGHHSFKELYDFRMLYNAAFFNSLHESGKVKVQKSFRHDDGEFCFGSNGEWFIVIAELPEGQVSNHYRKEHWELFNGVPMEIPTIVFDGHTPEDVLNRLDTYLRRP